MIDHQPDRPSLQQLYDVVGRQGTGYAFDFALHDRRNANTLEPLTDRVMAIIESGFAH